MNGRPRIASVLIGILLSHVERYRRGTSFWLCLERARLAYYRGENDALRTQSCMRSQKVKPPPKDEKPPKPKRKLGRKKSAK